MKTTMKKSVARLITLALVLVMVMSLAVPAMASELPVAEDLDSVRYGVFKFNLMFDKYNISRGSAFLINDEYIITAAHNIRLTEQEARSAGCTLDPNKANDNLPLAVVSYAVTVERDFTVNASLINKSENMDFAILKLEQKIPTRKYLKLRDSMTVKAGEAVYSVGFPAFNDMEDSDYTVSDVTIKNGAITKIQHDFTAKYTSGQELQMEVLDTSVAISGGDSGGPLVDANGNVVGISIASIVSDVNEANYYASAIDQVIRACDNLGIEYTMNDDVVEAVEAPVVTEAPVVETVAPTVAPTEAPVVETQAPVVVETQAPTQPVIVEEPDDPGINMTTILIVAAIAVVAVIVVIVVVMGKNKKQPAQPVYTDTLNRGQTSTMGAGETTVLSGDAGATTVLTRGGSLIRKRTGETIMVNSERFIIGRERKTSNYCIADNSSISRSHVTLIARGGVTYLMDMNAANGTYVNGVKVMANQEVALKNGDIIKLSDEEFEFRV